MILVQLPELAVDYVEVLIGKVIRDLINVLLLVQNRQDGEKVAFAQFRNQDAARPRFVHAVEDARNNLAT